MKNIHQNVYKPLIILHNLGTWIQILIVEGFVLLLLSKDMFENSKICQKKKIMKNFDKYWFLIRDLKLQKYFISFVFTMPDSLVKMKIPKM